jgi:glyoxylate reductase
VSKKYKVFITRQISNEAVRRLDRTADVEVWPGDEPPPSHVIEEKIATVDGLITLLTDPINETILSRAGPSLKVISQMAVGFDNIDIDAATARRIPVGHTPGVLTETCADFTWALLMAAARRVVEADREVRQGIWRPWGPNILTGPDIFGSTLGIIGLGRIGQAVARRAAGFGMRLLYYDNNRHPHLEKELNLSFADLDDLLAESDFVSVHLYLSPETRHFIDANRLAKMKPSAILLNTARGPIVDPDALTRALEMKIIAGAALDVFDPEPIPPDSPLLKMENVILTPHIASASLQTRERMAQMSVDNLLAGLAGQPLPNCANPKVYEL